MTSERPTDSCYWVVPGFLAGNYPRTGFEDSSRDKMRRILDAGVTCFLDLTTRHDPLLPYESLVEQLAGAGAMRIHYPVTDMGIPVSTAQTSEILDTIDRVRAGGGTVYLHCWGGVGRTGTMVGCWLVRHGMTGDEALARVAELWETRPDSAWSPSPQTDEQCEYVRGWSESPLPTPTETEA